MSQTEQRTQTQGNRQTQRDPASMLEQARQQLQKISEESSFESATQGFDSSWGSLEPAIVMRERAEQFAREVRDKTDQLTRSTPQTRSTQSVQKLAYVLDQVITVLQQQIQNS
jgi:hypothetical protein